MALGEAPPSAEGGGSSQSPRTKGQGPDGQWMLKLIYPNAVSLDSYLEVWLRQIAAGVAPGSGSGSASASVAAIDRFSGPTSYLSRQDDGPEFKKVSALYVGWRGVSVVSKRRVDGTRNTACGGRLADVREHHDALAVYAAYPSLALLLCTNSSSCE